MSVGNTSLPLSNHPASIHKPQNGSTGNWHGQPFKISDSTKNILKNTPSPNSLPENRFVSLVQRTWTWIKNKFSSLLNRIQNLFYRIFGTTPSSTSQIQPSITPSPTPSPVPQETPGREPAALTPSPSNEKVQLSIELSPTPNPIPQETLGREPAALTLSPSNEVDEITREKIEENNKGITKFINESEIKLKHFKEWLQENTDKDEKGVITFKSLGIDELITFNFLGNELDQLFYTGEAVAQQYTKAEPQKQTELQENLEELVEISQEIKNCLDKNNDVILPILSKYIENLESEVTKTAKSNDNDSKTLTLHKTATIWQCLNFFWGKAEIKNKYIGYREKINLLIDILYSQLSEQRFSDRAPNTLYNIGNSCYINAGIQMLLAGGFLTNRIDALLDRYERGESSLESKNHEVIVALKNVCETMRSADGTGLIPALYGFRFSLFQSGINPDLRFQYSRHHDGYSKQHDGATFLEALFDLLDYKITAQQVTTLKSDEGYPLDKREENSIVSLLRLNLVSTPTTSYPFQTLFNRYFGLEELGNDVKDEPLRHDGNLYKNYSRQTKINGAPPKFMPIQMVRMLNECDNQTKICRIRKIHDKVPFPKDEMIDAKDAFGSKTPVKYEIVSFECHLGPTPDGGHYICYRKEEGKWFQYDDYRANEVTKDQAHEAMSVAYNILLEKVDN